MNQGSPAERMDRDELTDFSQTSTPGAEESERFREEVARADFSGLRNYLSRSRAAEDWQDRVLIVREVTPFIPVAAMDFACEAETTSADLFLLQSSMYAEIALTKRGGGTSDRVGEQQWEAAWTAVGQALTALQRVTELDPADPTGYACVMRALLIFNQTRPHLQQAFLRARELAPNLAAIYEPVVTSLAKRWGGSNEGSIDFARSVLKNAPPQTDLPFCLFHAHLLAQTHFLNFDKDEAGSGNYLHNPAITTELNSAFDAWIRPPYAPRRSSIPYLQFAAMWYYQQEDRERLERCFAIIGGRFCAQPWYHLGKAQDVFKRARLIASGRPVTKPVKLKAMDECIAAVNLCLKAAAGADWKRSTVSLAVALDKAMNAAPEEDPFLSALVLLNSSWVCQKMGKAQDAKDCKERAFAKLDSIKFPLQSSRYQYWLAKSLQQLAEYQRAIPCWEEALLLSDENTDPGEMQEMLYWMGEAYLKIGLPDHSLAPLRSALEMCQKLPGETREGVVLIALGNALRKTAPKEAENYYRRAASVYEAGLKVISATPAWINLGVLCSEQGRYDESLEYLQKALRVREQSPGTSKGMLAVVHNNLANTYRRMGRFKDAHASVDRAIKLAGPGDMTAAAYGTRGLIYQAAGEDKPAGEWLRKAREEREKQPSPNLASMADDLEREIAGLKRLGRMEEASVAERRLAATREAIASVPQAEGGHFAGSNVAEQAAVMIELSVLIRSPETRERLNAFKDLLAERAEAYGAGKYRRWVAIPESTTLIFLGPDPDLLYRALEPVLLAESIASGATVRIRGNGALRELAIPQRRHIVN